MPRRPNVLLVVFDHANAQAAAPDGPCLTPNLDDLAREGARFAHCYTTNAICSPARASLMTGTYPSTHGVWDCTHTQPAGWVDLRGPVQFWARRFAEAGYATGYFGKWHVEPGGRLERFGWQEYDTACGSARSEPDMERAVVVETPGYRPYLLAAPALGEGPRTHPAFDRAIEFVRRCAAGRRPFCCAVSTAEPHDPYVPPRRFLDLYDPSRAPLPPTLREGPDDGKPEVVHRMRRLWEGLSDEQWRRVRAAYWAVVSFLDSQVGRLVEALKEAGLYESTAIVVTSDHGDMLGAHGLATKGVGTPYEEVYNVPLVMKVPGMPALGEQGRHLVSLVDIGPTLLDLCGLAPLEPCQGRSLRPVLEGRSDPEQWREAYAEFYGQRFVYTQRIVWRWPWKYVFSPGGLDELYNLEADPDEAHNLAADPRQRDTLLRMVRLMWRTMRRIGDQSLLNTHYATLRTAPLGPLAADEE